MIQVKNLIKNYGDVNAVRDINFEVNDGEILGFLGANGAGKSTTLKVMTGYLAATSGNIFVDDLNIRDHSLEIRKKIGYLPELNPLYQEMRAFDLLKFTGQIRGIQGKAFRQALSRVLEECGLHGMIHKLVGELSKGYKQRLGLASAMLHDPEILILDEPVTGLDPNQIVEIRKLIKKLGKKKMVIISSHILQEIEATVDRIIIIHEGSIVANGTSQDLMSGFQGKTQLTLGIQNATDSGISDMAEKIPNLNIINTKTENGSFVITMDYDKTADPRESIFKYAVDNKWVILEMSPQKVQLEDLFRTLTLEGGVDA